MSKIKKNILFVICIIIVLILIIFFIVLSNNKLLNTKSSNTKLSNTSSLNNNDVKNPNKNTNIEWKITQFGDNIGGQMMSFVIEGDKNGLVIIDGGYKDNEEQYNFLMEKIKSHNNIVDSWIITHFDSDHGGEFTRIINSSDIQVKNIYVPDTPTDIEILKNNIKGEEDWSIYEEYLSLDLPQKIKVHEDDTFEFIGLKMKVLFSYDDWVDEETDNLLNNGSMVFKLYGNKESLLFCGDVQNGIIGEHILNNHKNELESDYIQVAHHGNNWLSEEFYKIVSPKIAFFCAPDWLIENTYNIDWFSVKKIRTLLEDMGTKILWYNTSPNILIFK